MSKKIGYGRQSIDKSDVAAVKKVLESDWLTQGPVVGQFEAALCRYTGAKFAAVVNSGTSALHLAGLALGWKSGDVILTVPTTFVASANCILYAGARPDFVDISWKSYTIDVERLKDKLKKVSRRGKRIKAVIAVDYAGHPCDWSALRKLSDRYGFQLIDDACHALGAEYQGENICNARYADAVILSFHPLKHITTGEGGAVLTNEKTIHNLVKRLSSHGIVKKQGQTAAKMPWYYEMIQLGFNFRLSDLQCALGINQLRKINGFLRKRREIARLYRSLLSELPGLTLPPESDEIRHAYHLFPVCVDFNRIDRTKADLFRHMASRNIFCQVHYIPVHLQPYYRRNFSFTPGQFPVSEKFYQCEVSLPIYPTLRREELNKIIRTFREFFETSK